VVLQAIVCVTISASTIVTGDSDGRIILTTTEGQTLSSLRTRGATRQLLLAPAANQKEQQLCVHDSEGLSVCCLSRLRQGNAADALAHLAFDSTDGPVLSCFWCSDGCMVVVFQSSQIKVIMTRGDELGVQQAACQTMQSASACAFDTHTGKLAVASGHEVRDL
jgi:hypothetical protein